MKNAERNLRWLLVALPAVLPLAFADNVPVSVICFAAALLVPLTAGRVVTAIVRIPAMSIVSCHVLGLLVVTTLFFIARLLQLEALFYGLICVVALAGTVLFLRHPAGAGTRLSWDSGAAVFASVCSLLVLPMFFLSYRSGQAETFFVGFAGRDPLYHLSLLRQLMNDVPPPNYIASGYPFPAYHYFADLTAAIIPYFQQHYLGVAVDFGDIYFRVFLPITLFLAFHVTFGIAKKVTRSVAGAVVGALLIAGWGNIAFIPGILQMAGKILRQVEPAGYLWLDWSQWEGTGAPHDILHRPAEQFGRMIFTTAALLVLDADNKRRHWALSGLMLGMMAGYNYTLAVTFGLAAVAGAVLLELQRNRSQSLRLLILAAGIVAGSLPVNAAMLLNGFHDTSGGVPFSGTGLGFVELLWGELMGRLLPAALVPFASLLAFVVVCYGVTLAGLQQLWRRSLDDATPNALGTLLAVSVMLSFLVGTMLEYQGIGGLGSAIIFLQPTSWLLALFALRPVEQWCATGSGQWGRIRDWKWGWKMPAAFCLTIIPALQMLLSIYFSSNLVFSASSMQALQELHVRSGPDDVIAYLPTDLESRPLLGTSVELTNYTMTALTGQPGYFGPDNYTIAYALPGIDAPTQQQALAIAGGIAQQRRSDVTEWVLGNGTPQQLSRLLQDHVRWVILMPSQLPFIARPPATPWRETDQLVIYELQAR